MPTKRNRAGNQQNYVPSGNGDASGEYGDNETGSNKHFKQFIKQLSKEEMIAKQKEYMRNEYKELLDNHRISNQRYEKWMREIETTSEEQLLNSFYKNFPEYRPKYDDFNSFIDVEKPNVSEKFLNGMKKDFTYGVESSQKLIMDLINHSDITYDCTENDDYAEEKEKVLTYYRPAKNGVFFALSEYESDNMDESHVAGGTFYHESGHAIDDNYNYTEDKALIFKASETFITSTGKTLKQTLMGRKKWTIQQRLEEAQKEEEQFKKEFYAKRGASYEETYQKIENIQNEARETQEFKKYANLYEQMRNIYERKVNEYGNPFEYRKANIDEYNDFINNFYALKNNLDTILYKYHEEEQKSIRQKIKNIDYEYQKKKHQTFGDISDMFCMQGQGYAFGMGHKTTYARDTDARANEFFAECFSAESTNPESLRLIKKYFPEGYQAYREIMDAINSGKLMTKEQHALKEKKGKVAN